MSALPQDFSEEAVPHWELNGDQYEMFGVPPGPSAMFRKLLGQSAPPPELLVRVEDQYEIFPELGAALTPKAPLPPGMVDDDELGKLQHVLDGTEPKGKQLELVEEEEAPKRAQPDFGPAETYYVTPRPEGSGE